MIQIPNHTLETLIRQLPIVFESVPRETVCKNTRIANALRLAGNAVNKLKMCNKVSTPKQTKTWKRKY